MQQQDKSNIKSKRFLLIESNKQYKIERQQQLLQIEDYIDHLIAKYHMLKTKLSNQTEPTNITNNQLLSQQKQLKKLSQILSRVPSRVFYQYRQHFETIIDKLIQLVKQHNCSLSVGLLISILSPQLKCELRKKEQCVYINKNNYNNNNKCSEQNIIALPASPPQQQQQQQSIIALPSSSSYYDNNPNNNNTTLVIINNPTTNDIITQQHRQQSQQYFIQDDKLVEKYLQQRFFTINRDGISELFRIGVQKITNQFIQPLIINESQMQKLTIEQLISLIKLIQHLSPSFYTYYLLSLIKTLTETILNNFDTTTIHHNVHHIHHHSHDKNKNNNNFILNKQNNTLSIELTNKLKRTQYQQIIYLFKTLTQRWSQHKNQFNIQLWLWQIQTSMINTFISSVVSQKQLYSIKTLIDRIHKVQYNSYSVINQSQLIKFLQENHILTKIYNPQNHPQVIIKGKQVFQYVAKQIGLNKQMIDLLFEMITKSNDSLGKALYSTLHAVGYENLEINKQYIMKKIQALPRAGLFYDETFSLIQSLILLSPLQYIQQSLSYTCNIIKVHYLGLKPQLQHKLLNIYFQVYLMGIQQGVFGNDIEGCNNDDYMICLLPFLTAQNQHNYNNNNELLFIIIDKFIQKLKQQLPKKIGQKCKLILNTSIKLLFNKYKILKLTDHIQQRNKLLIKQPTQTLTKKNHLQLIKQLLQCIDHYNDNNLTNNKILQQQQLLQLIQKDSYFGRYLSYYSTQSQFYLLQKILTKHNITSNDIKNIIETFNFIRDEQVKRKVLDKIVQVFLQTNDIMVKEMLVGFVVKMKRYDGRNVQRMIQKQIINNNNNNKKQLKIYRLLGVLMIFKHSLSHNDTLYSYDTNPPFKYLTNDYQLTIKVLNLCDVLNPISFQIKQKHYITLKQCLLKTILPIVGKRLQQVKIKIDKGEQYVRWEQLTNRLNEITPYRQLSITIQQTINNQSSWQDTSLLINPKTNQLNQHIQQILTQIFNHYSQQHESSSNLINQQQKHIKNYTKIIQQKQYKHQNNKRKLNKKQACKIFAIATNVQEIVQKDARILHLFNNYSQTGQYLTLIQWINFYYQSALTNPQLVIDNLINLGYGDVFKSMTLNDRMEQQQQNRMEQQQQNRNDYNIKRQQSKNKFRQYFSNNQQIFNCMIQLASRIDKQDKQQRLDKQNSKIKLENNNQVNQKMKIIKQRVKFIVIELFQQLPKWKQLQKDIIKEFSSYSQVKRAHNDDIINNNNNYSSRNISNNDRNNVYSNQQPLQKIYLTTIFLSYWSSSHQQYYQLKQQSYISTTQTTITTTLTRPIININKLRQYCIKQLHKLFRELICCDNNLQSSQQQYQQITQIDPLNLTYHQQLIIWSIQNITNNILIIQKTQKSTTNNININNNKNTNKIKSIFPQIQQIKTILDKDITQIQPLNNLKIDLFLYQEKERAILSIFRQRLIYQGLQKLCAIDYNMVVTYFSMIISQQLIPQMISSQQQHQQQISNTIQQYNQQQINNNTTTTKNNQQINQLLLPLIYSPQSIFSTQPHLRKLTNKLIFLIYDSIVGLKDWYMLDILSKIIQNLEQQQIIQSYQNKNNNINQQNKCLLLLTDDYFATLNQFIIASSDMEILGNVCQMLCQLVGKMVNVTGNDNQNKQLFRNDLINNPNLNNQYQSILYANPQLIQPILNCIKNILFIFQIIDTNINNSSKLKQKQQNKIKKTLLSTSQTLLTQQYHLQPTTQSHLYNILSLINHNHYQQYHFEQPNQQMNNLQFIHNILSQTRLKKNSKYNKQNQYQCGIYNLGCICYINAIFQQLYHIKQFAHYVMTTPIYNRSNNLSICLNNNKSKQQRIIQQSQLQYFNQFQHILYKLKHSHRQFITTQRFCQSFIDYTGQPINIKQQHDADQFLNQLLDKLQKTYLLKYNIPKQQTIIKQLFQGKMSNVITCQNCHTNKINLQQFYILSLQIKNMNTLKQCLQKMVEPQVICDYYCTVCDKKVAEIQKYRKFCQLPKILFIHYQRLVFDLQSFTKIKLQNPVMFDQQINFKEYFYQQQQQQQKNNNYKYRLLGFIVHFGNSQGGHYISLIKSKDNKNKNNINQKWKKYDDSKITKWFWKTGIHQKDNAYLLIYERVEDQDDNGVGQRNEGEKCMGEMIAQQQQQKQNKQLNINNNTTTRDKHVNKIIFNNKTNNNNRQVDLKLIQQIRQDNINLNKQLTTTQKQFTKFIITQLLAQSKKSQEINNQNSVIKKQKEVDDKKMTIEQNNSDDNDIIIQQQMLKCKIIWKHLMLIQQSRAIGICQTLPITDTQLQLLCALFIKHNSTPQSSQYFINIFVQKQAIRLLYTTQEKRLRQSFKVVFSNVLLLWVYWHTNIKNNNISLSSPHKLLLIPCIQNETIRKLLVQIENSLLQVGKSPTKMDQYFQFLFILIKLSPSIKQYFMEMNIIAKLVHFIMHKQSKLITMLGVYYPLGIVGNNKRLSCFNTIVDILSMYVKDYPQLITNNQLTKLSLGSQNIQFYQKLYSQRIENYQTLNQILSKNSKSNMIFINKVIDCIIIPNINRFNHDDCYVIAYIDLAYKMLLLKQESIGNKSKRYIIQRLLGIPMMKDVTNENMGNSNIMVRRKHQRIVGYWSNLLTDSDEIMFPMLQLLYTNRHEVNYFEIIGIKMLLESMVKDKQIRQYVMKLPSPCFAYDNYLSWIREYLRNIVKKFNTIRLEKIDVKQCLNKIAKCLQQLDYLQQEVIVEQGNNSHKRIQQQQQQIKKQQQQQQQMKKQQYHQHHKPILTSNKQQWLKRNLPYLFGQVVDKLQTRLIDIKVKIVVSGDDDNNNEDQNYVTVPLTYTILRTVSVNDWLEYANDVLCFDPIQQPSQQYLQPAVRRAMFEQYLFNKHCLSNQSNNLSNNQSSPSLSSIIILSFSGDNHQLLPYKNKNTTALRIQFLHKQYDFDMNISIDKLVNDSQCKIVVPSCKELDQLLVKKGEFKQYKDIDKVIKSMIICEVAEVDKKDKKKVMMKEKQRQENNNKMVDEKQQQHHHSKQNNITNNTTIILPQQPNQTTYQQQEQITDAYIVQHNQQQIYQFDNNNNNYQNNNNINENKQQQLCIQCPFCGYIAHQFVSRCPGCNQEWGLYA